MCNVVLASVDVHKMFLIIRKYQPRPSDKKEKTGTVNPIYPFACSWVSNKRGIKYAGRGFPES